MVVLTVLPRDHAWTVDDLADLPDDGLRDELVDGTLLVSAAPSKPHQRAVGNLSLLLRAACPPALEAVLTPTDYQPTRSRSLQPDLLVVSRADPGAAAVTMPLALGVEVLSPSSRSIDRVLERALYEQPGLALYCVVDPDEPSVSVWENGPTGFGEERTATGSPALELGGALPATLVPDALLR